MSEEWWQVMHAALKTATELDIEIGIFNSSRLESVRRTMGKTRTVHALPRLIRARRTRSQKDFGKRPGPRTRLSRRKSAAFKARRDNLFDRGSVSFSSNIKGFVDYQYALPAGAESHHPPHLPQAETVRGILIHPAYYLHTQCLLPGPRRERIQNNQGIPRQPRCHHYRPTKRI